MAANFFYLTMQFYYFYGFVALALALPVVFAKRRSYVRPLPVLALLCAVGFVTTFLVALHSARGFHDDDALFRHVSGNTAFPVRAAGAARELLLGIDAVFVLVALVLVVVLALVQGRFARAIASAAIVVCSVGSARAAEARAAASRPGDPGGAAADVSRAGIRASLSRSGWRSCWQRRRCCGRPQVWSARCTRRASGLSVILLGWHYPSDVVGSFFVCGFWAAAIASLLPRTLVRPSIAPVGALVAAGAVAGALIVAAIVAGRHPGAVEAIRSARSVVATAVALGVLSIAIFGAFTLLVAEEVRA